MSFEPSKALSFLMGAFLGDGSFVEDSDYHHFVRLSVRDRDLAEAFNQSVASVLCRRPNRITVTTNKGRVYFDAKYSSRLLGLFLRQPLEKLRLLADYYPAAFLRGLFSADGCGSVSAGEKRLRVRVVLTNSNLKLLEMAQAMLQYHFQISSKTYLSRKRGSTWNFLGRTVVLRKDAYLLMINQFAGVRTFAARIGFEIRRKQGPVEKAIELIENFGRPKAVEAWKAHVPKRGRWHEYGTSE